MVLTTKIRRCKKKKKKRDEKVQVAKSSSSTADCEIIMLRASVMYALSRPMCENETELKRSGGLMPWKKNR